MEYGKSENKLESFAMHLAAANAIADSLGNKGNNSWFKKIADSETEKFVECLGNLTANIAIDRGTRKADEFYEESMGKYESYKEIADKSPSIISAKVNVIEESYDSENRGDPSGRRGSMQQMYAYSIINRVKGDVENKVYGKGDQSDKLQGLVGQNRGYNEVSRSF